MKLLLLLGTLVISSVGFTQSKVDVVKVLDNMKKTGMFTAEQIEAAREQLLKMDDKKYNDLLNKAKAKAKDPAMQKKAMEAYKKTQKK